MLVPLDKYGSITLPAHLRQELGLEKGAYLELSLEEDGVIVLHPVNVQRTVSLNEEGLKKIEEARKSGTGELPEWITGDMNDAETDTDVEKGAAVRLTRRGKPVAVLLSIEEYQRLTGKQKDFWSVLTDFRQSFEPDEEDGISGQEFEGIRDSSPGREVVL